MLTNQKNRRLGRVLPTIMIFSSIALLIYSIWCGLGMTKDSIDYLTGGLVLSNGGHYMDVDYPTNIVPNGPVLPIILSIFGNNASSYYRVLTVLYLLITLYSFKFLAYELINNKFIRLFVLGAICFGTPLFMVFTFLWTESAFISVLAVTLVVVYMYVKSQNLTYLLLVGALSFLLTLSRKAGLVFPASIFLMLLLIDPNLYKRYKFILGLVIAGSGYFLWRIYILSFVGGATKMSSPEESIHLLSYQGDYLSSVGLWFSPTVVSEHIRIVMVAILAIGILVAFYFRKLSMSPHALVFSKILLACIIIYYGARSILERDLDEIDRYLSEIYPLSMLFIGMVADAVIVRFNAKRKLIIFSLSFIWLMYPVTRTVKNAVFWHSNKCTVQQNK